MPADSVDELQKQILTQYPSLSRRLQQVGQYLLDHPNDMALQTLTVIADRIGVQPSTIVRFAQALGYDGASAIQRLYRDELLSGRHSVGYRERIQDFRHKSRKSSENSPKQLISDLIEGNVLALEHLHDSASDKDLSKAAKSISKAQCVFVAGFGRSYAVAAYLTYALQRLDKRVSIIDGVGGSERQQIRQATNKDLLIAVSFAPYSSQIKETLKIGSDNKVKMIGITDSRVSPVCVDADIQFVVADAEIRQFRSLATTMVLAQAIVLSYAFNDVSS